MRNAMNTPPTIRLQLLSTVSALALLTSAYSAGAASSDIDRPTLWIELGGQMENITGQGEVFAPAFLAQNSTSAVLQAVTPLQAQRPPKFSFGEEGKISFQPEGSDWVFSAAVRIGRASNFRNIDHQTSRILSLQYPYTPSKFYRTDLENFAKTQARRQESHTVLDFSAGKDVGLGLFGKGDVSVLSAGIRFAQFQSNATVDIRARPDLHINYVTFGPFRFPGGKYYHTYHATGRASRDFHGIGPSISWSNSIPVLGNPESSEIALDWGVNAAVLFGKQRTAVRHQESAHFGSNRHPYTTVYVHPPAGHSTNRSVTVPNLGGFAGISFQHGDAKVSFGYRADFFFGAVDGGIDARKNETLGFKGPFASISIGLGD